MSYIVHPDKPLGDYKAVYLARASSEEIRKRRIGSGGAVTALLLYMIEEGVVDAVVTAKKKTGFTGEIVIARSRDELLEAAGDKWTVLPFTMKLKDSLSDESIRRVAIVGLPCQAQFIWQMKMFPMLETDFSHKISFIISLVCLGTFATEAFLNYLKTHHGMDPEKVSSIYIVGDYIETVYEGEKRTIPIKDIIPYMQLGCLVCPDYTGVFSDLSAGISENYPGYTVLISRTDVAEKYLRDACSRGYIEIMKAPLSVVEELEIKSKAKIIRATKYMSIVL